MIPDGLPEKATTGEIILWIKTLYFQALLCEKLHIKLTMLGALFWGCYSLNPYGLEWCFPTTVLRVVLIHNSFLFWSVQG